MGKIALGHQIPDAKVWVGSDPVQTREFFKGKNVALFSLPGAFTPVCSGKQLPGFVALADELKAQGVDEIVCVSVNDAFVMKAWGEEHDKDGKVVMMADGNASFAQAMGFTLDASGFGMGTRFARGSFYVRDGEVAIVNEDGVELENASAEVLLKQIKAL